MDMEALHQPMPTLTPIQDMDMEALHQPMPTLTPIQDMDMEALHQPMPTLTPIQDMDMEALALHLDLVQTQIITIQAQVHHLVQVLHQVVFIHIKMAQDMVLDIGIKRMIILNQFLLALHVIDNSYL
jgi:hypothetical protein